MAPSAQNVEMAGNTDATAPTSATPTTTPNQRVARVVTIGISGGYASDELR